ncbi:uncharacterized protein P174DRAFT_432940 [Aspergillus novofumigatus IBT 16806]|uniref:Uncharacterized protein n=1 Tax=Aspergillus novofumigatus (strain IBT 16806) TaxID=1392255 RepID=A0A2I1C1J9_ASPN1|nr:uncharacterized protein P174DRAFT_432940 [Aspergillus novofumigatus IBT 16806]PKX91489.1 hypothetical protein P174DRAFT_432940 [Aspergillus novofumigatus IBT 16806]
MTSHPPSVPLPGSEEKEHSSGITSPMTFYISTIELYRILDSILSDIYRAWRGRSSPGSRRHTIKHGGLDIIIELEEKLFEYENNLPFPQLELSIRPSYQSRTKLLSIDSETSSTLDTYTFVSFSTDPS